MKNITKTMVVSTAIALTLLPAILGAAADQDGWTQLFDGRSLEGWKASDNPATFSVKDGAIVVRGPRAHLFYVGPAHQHDFKNFELKADVLTKPGSNSGIYFHTRWQEVGWPDHGYEVQVNNSHGDPKRTAGLYDIQENYDTVAKDGEWFTLHIIVQGKRIITKVNDKVVIDFSEPADPKPLKNHSGRVISSGTFALQGHDPKSEVHFKNIRVKPLP